MRILLIIILAIISGTGCNSSRYTLIDGQPFAFKEGTTLLITSIAGKSDHESYEIFKSVKKGLSGSADSIYFLPALDYEFKIRNIHLDSVLRGSESHWARLRNWKGNTSILALSVVSTDNIGNVVSYPANTVTPNQSRIPSKAITWQVNLKSDDDYLWTYQVTSTRNGASINGVGINVYSSAFNLGLRKSLEKIQDVNK